MKRIPVAAAAAALLAMSGTAWAGDPAEMAETCIDCHDVEEFAGMDAATIVAKSAEGNAESKMMAKATADLSAEDLQTIADYLAAEANK
jgi:cytochrome c553